MNASEKDFGFGFFPFLSKQARLTCVSVLFVFNDSLNDDIPERPIMFPVNLKNKFNKSFLLVFHCISSCLRLKISVSSVVLTSNDLHNDFPP